jgi:hypothetical protein
MSDLDRVCKICEKRLRRLCKTTDWQGRIYHISCYKGIIKDVYNYNEVAYTKYGHEKRIDGILVSELKKKKNHKFIINFD